MAKEQVEVVTDDLGGEHGASERVFEIDGKTVTADLTDKHYREAAKIVAQYNDYMTRMRTEHEILNVLYRHINAAGVPSGKGRGKNHKAAVGNKDESAAIREWAAQNDIHVAPRGRIAKPIVERYHQRGAAALPKRKTPQKAAAEA